MKDPRSGFWKEFISNKSFFMNILVLKLTFFTLGYNCYGIMNGWKGISIHQKVFEHNILAVVLGWIGKIGAFVVCYITKRKCLPLMILQIFTAICYFILPSVEFDPNQPFGLGMMFVIHVSRFFNMTSFALVWTIAPETFPKKYR